MAAKSSMVKSGLLLLSEPFLLDPYFQRSVVLLCEHHGKGSLGFILNKKTDMKINDLVDTFPDFNAPVYYGGPVQTDTLHYLHNAGNILDESYVVADGLWMGGDFEKLKFLIQHELIGLENIRFYIGYSGWESGQLDDELETGSWITADLDNNYVFNANADELWPKVMYNKGAQYEIISTIPEFISLN